MAKPNSRQSLVDYALRALGAPVVEINIDDDQLGDRLDEALQVYQEYHSDAVIKRFYAHTITSEDEENEFIPVPSRFLWVTRILPFSSFSEFGDFRPEYQMMLQDVLGMISGESMVDYYMMKTHISLINNMFDSLNVTFDFNRHMEKLFIFTRWGTDLRAGDIIILEAYEAVDPETYPNIYNDRLLKRYFTALVKKQWGANIKKFGNMQLPGGVTIEGQAIFDEAKEEIRELEEKIQEEWEIPPAFYIG